MNEITVSSLERIVLFLNEKKNELIVSEKDEAISIKLHNKPRWSLGHLDYITDVMEFMGSAWLLRNYEIKRVFTSQAFHKKEELQSFLSHLQQEVNKKIERHLGDDNQKILIAKWI